MHAWPILDDGQRAKIDAGAAVRLYFAQCRGSNRCPVASLVGCMASDPRKKALLDGLKDLVWKTYELEETIKNFGPESQTMLNERMVRFIDGVRELQPLATAVEGVQVPRDLLQYVDKGGNPHQYTAEVFRACTRDNQVSKGKVDALQALHDSVLSQMEQSMPEEAAQYKQLTAQSQHLQRPPVEQQLLTS